MSIETSMDRLHPKFRQIALACGEIWASYLLPVRFNGFKVRIMETLRTPERQAELEAGGKSKVKVGFHNYGLALDFAIFGEQGVYITDGNHPAYLACGQIAEAFGCVWGGRWTGFKDSGHIEYHPGVTLQQLIASEGRDLIV